MLYESVATAYQGYRHTEVAGHRSFRFEQVPWHRQGQTYDSAEDSASPVPKLYPLLPGTMADRVLPTTPSCSANCQEKARYQDNSAGTPVQTVR